MPQLTVSFSFLCALVPERSFFGDPKPKKATVLLRDLREVPQKFSNADSPTPKEHFALVHYLNGNRITEATAEIPLPESPRSKDDEDGSGVRELCYLDGEELEFWPDGEKANGGLDPTHFVPPGVNDQLPSAKSIWWVTSIRDVVATSGQVKSGLIGSPTPAPKLAGRVLLDQGKLWTPKLSSHTNLLPEAGVQRKIALWFGLELGFDKFVDVRFRKFGQQKVKTLRLIPQPGYNEIGLWIRNCEKNFLWKDDRANYGGLDLDFEFYHEMRADYLPDKLHWVPEANAPQGDSGNCSPSRLP